MKLLKNTILAAVAALGLAASANAITINFGTTLEASDTYNGTSYYAGNVGNTETQIAGLINTAAGTTYVAGDILKPAAPSNTNGQFAVPSGYLWLAVQYDGPNGGTAIFSLGGNDALVPYNSAPLWGTGNQYGVSHYGLAGRFPTTPPPSVPEGGVSVMLLGGALLGLGAVRRFLRR